MAFFRNTEVQKLCVLMGAAALILGAAGFAFGPATGGMVLLAVLLCTAVFLIFTAWRYRQIDALSAYLQRIAAGEYALDVRDNAEGELSVLKSEIYKVTVTLSEINDRLAWEKRQLADSLADISHQLKTPLTSMMVMADLLQDDGLPAAKRREFTDQVRTQLARIEWLVSSLLKIAKLDAEVIILDRQPVPVGELVKQAAAPLLIPMELKEIAWETEGDEGALLPCDRDWTAEALGNILKNCVEHTPQGGRLHVTWRDNPLFTEIAVQDSGEGIPPEDLPHIFTRFYRGRNAAKDSVGIGLAMARTIFQRQGGNITATSRPGHGTRFLLRVNKAVV